MTKITKLEIDNLRMILEAAQSQMGATPPTEIEDDDPDDIQHWRDIDDGLAVLDRLTVDLNSKYVVRMQKPSWADGRFSAMLWYFWKYQHVETPGQPHTPFVVVERLHKAHAFESLAAAEMLAVQIGGVVETYASQYSILANRTLEGDMKSNECAKYISEANKL